MLSTKYLQDLIDYGASKGETVYIPKGVYEVGTLFLRSNINIVMHHEAILLGSLNLGDFAPDERNEYIHYQDISHSCFDMSMFVGRDCENISISGGKIDMRSVWEPDNFRNNAKRGAKGISLKNCKNIKISNLELNNATDIAIYFAGCENVVVDKVKLRVYIDGICPDCSKNVRITDCDVECGDDGIVLKSSYTLNRKERCENIEVSGCRIKSRCNAIKFGTETNGGFANIYVHDCSISQTRLAGLALEIVDGGIMDGVRIERITMQNVGTPIFVYLGNRARGPKGTVIGKIKNISLSSITATGPYLPYKIIEWNYASFVDKDTLQKPWVIGIAEGFDDRDEPIVESDAWQITSVISGAINSPIENLLLKDIYLSLAGGCLSIPEALADAVQDYPEVYVFGRILPAKGILFRNINNLTLDNVIIATERKDIRQDFVFDNVEFCCNEEAI